MTGPLLVHASCIAVGGRGVLILGGSGSGKSDLAFRLIDRGAGLVGDDYVELRRSGARLLAAAPARIAGRIELRGVGIVEPGAVAEVPLCLAVDLGREPERLPEPKPMSFAGVELPSIGLAALEASAPIKLEQALRLFGLPLP